MANEMTLPSLGESIKAGDVLRVLIKAGDAVTVDQPVLELETDKATVEVPSSLAGTVAEVRVKDGDRIDVGQVMFTVSGDAAATPAPPASGSQVVSEAAAAVDAQDAPGAAADPAAPPRPLRRQPAGTHRGDHPVARREREGRRRPARARQGGGHGCRRAGHPRTRDRQGHRRSAVPERGRGEGNRGEGRRQGRRRPTGAGPRRGRIRRDLGAQGVGTGTVGGRSVRVANGCRAGRDAGTPGREGPAHGADRRRAPRQGRRRAPAPEPWRLPVRTYRRPRRSVVSPGNSASISRTYPDPGRVARISESDVRSHAKNVITGKVAGPAGAAPAGGGFAYEPLPDFSVYGTIERKAMRGIRRKTAEHMVAAWHTIPHVTQCEKVDITALEQLRKQFGKRVEAGGGKLTVTSIITKVIAVAMRRFPQFNTSVDLAAEEVGLQVVRQHRHRRRHRARPARAGAARRRHQDDHADLRRARAAGGEGARPASCRSTRCRAAASRSPTSAASAARTSRRSSTHPEVAILGISRRLMEPVWNGTSSSRG